MAENVQIGKEELKWRADLLQKSHSEYFEFKTVVNTEAYFPQYQTYQINQKDSPYPEFFAMIKDGKEITISQSKEFEQAIFDKHSFQSFINNLQELCNKLEN